MDLTPLDGAALAPAASIEYAAHLAGIDAELEAASLAPATVAAYERQWSTFESWCRTAGLDPLPATPTTLRGYIAHLHTLAGSVSGLEQAMAAIKWKHVAAGEPCHTGDEAVRQRRQGFARMRADSRPARMPPLLVDNIRRIISVMAPDDPPAEGEGRDQRKQRLRDARDRAVILVGFASGGRRSNLARLDVPDLTFGPQGMDVYFSRSKTDQAGRGRVVAINFGEDPRTCPVTAVRTWLRVGGVTDGRVFRRIDSWGNVRPGGISPQVIRTIVRDRALAVGLEGFAAHSLRAGFATQAAFNGVPRGQIKEDGGWVSDQVVGDYTRHLEGREHRTSGRLGL